MNRLDFIKTLITLFGVSAIPKSLYIQYHRVHLLQCFVRGFRFYEGPKLLKQMRKGSILELKREPDNQHDSQAIALYFNHQKIGFLPKEKNTLFSKLLDADLLKLHAEITHLEPKAKAWENVAIVIYALKESESELPSKAHYLSLLETPKYLTVKLNKNKVVNIYQMKGKINIEENTRAFYKNNTIREKIQHTQKFNNEEEILTAGKDLKFVIKKPDFVMLSDYEKIMTVDFDEFEAAEIEIEGKLVRIIQLKHPNAYAFNKNETERFNRKIIENAKIVTEKFFNPPSDFGHIENLIPHQKLQLKPSTQKPITQQNEKKYSIKDLDQIIHEKINTFNQYTEEKIHHINTQVEKAGDIDKHLRKINKKYLEIQKDIIERIEEHNNYIEKVFDETTLKIENEVIHLESVFNEAEIYACKLTDSPIFEKHLVNIVDKADKIGNIFYQMIIKF